MGTSLIAHLGCCSSEITKLVGAAWGLSLKPLGIVEVEELIGGVQVRRCVATVHVSIYSGRVMLHVVFRKKGRVMLHVVLRKKIRSHEFGLPVEYVQKKMQYICAYFLVHTGEHRALLLVDFWDGLYGRG